MLINEITDVIKKEQLILSTSCSLLHTPFTLKYETKLDSEVKNWLAYAVQKLDELALLSKLTFDGEESLKENDRVYLEQNTQASRLALYTMKVFKQE